LLEFHALSERPIPSFESDDYYQEGLLTLCKHEGKVLLELAVIICSDDELLNKNKEVLDHDYLTDIITLDYCIDDQIIGDLFISIDRVEENAKEMNVGVQQEFLRVIVHGVLHLCGYPDKTDQEKVIMRSKEDFYISLLNN